MEHQPYARVIVNPLAGTGLTGRKWPHIREELTHAGLSFDFMFTEGKGHAIELAREAARAGYEMVVASGGDGTLNEVVNGLVESGNATNITLGILNTGTGCDFARFLNIPRDHRLAVSRLVNPRKVLIDVGVIDCQNENLPVHRFFIGAAGLGFDGEVVKTAVSTPRVLHGNTPYFLGILHSLGTYRNKEVHLQIDENSEDIRICSVVIANAGFYASGMRMAPEADLRDGLFEVMVAGDVNKLELLQAIPKLYRGVHRTHPKIKIEKAAEVTVESLERIFIQADGEFVGEGPACFSVLPSALNIAA